MPKVSGASSCDLDVDGGELWSIDDSGYLEFISMGEIPE